MKKDMNVVFKVLLEKYLKLKERDMISRLKKANDKEFVFHELKKEIAFYLKWFKADKDKENLVKTFILDYKRGNDLNKTIDHIQRVYGHDIEDIKPFRIIKGGKAFPVYISEEEKRLKEFTLDDRKLLKHLIRVVANNEIQKKIKEIYSKAISPEQPKSKPSDIDIKWTGTKTDNKNEFVQLVYGLHKAGFINKGEGEITKIIESLADVFGVELGKNWQSNHSASIHKAKHNYEPAIFKKIKDAYAIYSNSLIQEKKKR